MRVSSLVLIGLVLAVAVGGCSSSSSPSGQLVVDTGALKLYVTESPWKMTFSDADGNPVLVELPDTGDGPSGSLGMHLGPPPLGNGQQPALPPAQANRPVPPDPARTR